MWRFFVVRIAFLILVFLSQNSFAQLQNVVEQYEQKFQFENVFEKLVNNRGQGFDPLYGTRNFREVLKGVYYRGGANNKYHRSNPRSNMNPLPEDGLKNLCQQGFSKAIYFYKENYKTSSPLIHCELEKNQKHQLKYEQITAFDKNTTEPLLKIIYQKIVQQGEGGPIYGHCWNGWHASGLIAALALRQFCDWDGDRALDYWIQNTDGNSDGYKSIKKSIVDFKKIKSLEISYADQKLICPN